jgi:hypothetical protein
MHATIFRRRLHGSFTGNRQALLIAEDGGHVVNTPVYTAADNRQIRNADAVVDENGNLHISLKTIYTGVEQQEAHTPDQRCPMQTIERSI